MWLKRPYGQLAKCAEAQALRKAFPEIVSQQPTAEEMEGKTFCETPIYEFNECSANSEPKTITLRSTNLKAQTLSARLDKFLEEPEALESILTIPNNENCLQLQGLIAQHNIPQELVSKWCDAGGVTTLEELNNNKVQSCIDYILAKSEAKSNVEQYKGY